MENVLISVVSWGIIDHLHVIIQLNAEHFYGTGRLHVECILQETPSVHIR